MITILFSALSLAIGLLLGMSLTLRPGRRWGVPDSPACKHIEQLLFLILGEGRGNDPYHPVMFGKTTSEEAVSNHEKRSEIKSTEPGSPVMISMLVSDSSGLDLSDEAIGFHALMPKPISTTEYNRTLDLASSLHLDIAKNPIPNERDSREWAEKLISLHDHIYTQILESKSQSLENGSKD